jgi:hypothetical protein
MVDHRRMLSANQRHRMGPHIGIDEASFRVGRRLCAVTDEEERNRDERKNKEARAMSG